MAEWSDGQSTPLALTKIHAKDAIPRDLQEGCVICSAALPALQGKTQGHIRDHLKKNLWGIAVLCPASTALQGTRRKFLHLPTSTAQFLQYLFAANPSIMLALGLVFVELLQCIPLKA